MSKETIYRQDAIETIRKCAVKEVTPAYMLIDKAEAMTELMNLPSAQPVIRTQMSSADCIDRQAAIDALEKGKPLLFINEDGSIDPFGAGQQNQWYRDGIVIMNLPSAEPEPCDFCVYNRDCGDMRLYCPARGGIDA